MFSPQERVYTTPDVSIPAAQAIIRQLELNSLVRRCAYLTCAQHCWFGPKPISLPRRKDDSRLLMTELGRLAKRKAATRIAKMANNQQEVRSRIPGAPADDPYLQRPRQTVAGGKYGGVHFSKHATESRVDKPDLFKRFYPQKCSMRLPAIQREKELDTCSRNNANNLSDKEMCKNINLMNKKTELPKISKQKEKRKRKLKQETDFLHWERTREIYQSQLQKLAQESDHRLLQRQEHFHVPSNAMLSEESYQRGRISKEIKRGVLRKLEFFQEKETIASERKVTLPVLKVKFEMKHREETSNNLEVVKNCTRKRKRRTHKINKVDDES